MNVPAPAISARDKPRIVFVSFFMVHLFLSLAAAGRVPRGARAVVNRNEGITIKSLCWILAESQT